MHRRAALASALDITFRLHAGRSLHVLELLDQIGVVFVRAGQVDPQQLDEFGLFVFGALAIQLLVRLQLLQRHTTEAVSTTTVNLACTPSPCLLLRFQLSKAL